MIPVQALCAARSIAIFVAIFGLAAICCAHFLADEKQEEEWKAPPRAARKSRIER